MSDTEKDPREEIVRELDIIGRVLDFQLVKDIAKACELWEKRQEPLAKEWFVIHHDVNDENAMWLLGFRDCIKELSFSMGMRPSSFRIMQESATKYPAEC